jgi:glucose-1-phosphate cytidylyltransferase
MRDLTAIVLAGGKGERLRPYTDSAPKPLIPLNGRPLLEHLLAFLSAGGIRRFVLCTGYKAEMIERYMRECNRPDWDVACINSGDVAMTDRLLDARRHVSDQALVCYGDTLANVDLARLRHEHEVAGALMTMTVYPLHSPFGIVHLDGRSRIGGFSEKPRLPHWINIGFLLCEPAALEMLRPGTDMPEYLSALVATGRMHAHRHEGKHLTVNTEKDRSRAESEIIEFYTVGSDLLREGQ